MNNRFLAGPALSLGLLASGAQSGTWTVSEIGGAPVAVPATVTFGPEGSVHVDTGCNLLRMSGRMEGATLVIDGPVAATRMACPGDLAAQEQALEQVFRGDVALIFDPFSQSLKLQAGDMTASLVAAAPADQTPESAPAPDLWQTHGGREKPAGSPPYLAVFGLAGDMPVRAEPQDGADVRGGVPSGTLLRNEGCADGWCVVETLDGSVAGWARSDTLEPADDALRAGQGIFDATGLTSCRMAADATPQDCLFGVARGDNGTATVVVRRPDDMRRALFFREGRFASTDSSQAAGGFDTSATRDGDLTTVRIDDETYAIPDAALFGG